MEDIGSGFLKNITSEPSMNKEIGAQKEKFSNEANFFGFNQNPLYCPRE